MCLCARFCIIQEKGIEFPVVWQLIGLWNMTPWYTEHYQPVWTLLTFQFITIDMIFYKETLCGNASKIWSFIVQLWIRKKSRNQGFCLSNCGGKRIKQLLWFSVHDGMKCDLSFFVACMHSLHHAGAWTQFVFNAQCQWFISRTGPGGLFYKMMKCYNLIKIKFEINQWAWSKPLRGNTTMAT